MRDDLRMNLNRPSRHGKASVLALMAAAFALLLIVTACLSMHGFCAGDDTLVARAMQDETHPVADAGENMTVPVWKPVIFDASGSTDDTGIVNYTWTLEDGGTVTLFGTNPTYTFGVVGVYNVTLTVQDGEGNSDNDSVFVTVVPDETPPVADSVRGFRILVGTMVTLNASGSTDNAAISSYLWTISKDGETLDVLEGAIQPYYFNETGNYTIVLTVTDASGLTNSTTIYMNVYDLPTWLERNWYKILLAVLIIIGISWLVISKFRRDKALVTKTDIEKMQLRIKSSKKTWKVFKANRLGFAGFIVLWVFVFMAVFAPLISLVPDPKSSDYMEPTIRPDWVNPLPPTFEESSYTGLIHPLGTDSVGRDIYSMTIYGARASLLVGLVATLISVILGTSIGLAAGYFGRVTSEVLMRITDFFLVLPWFPLMIVMMAILGQDFIWVIVVIGITGWPSTARIVRSQVLTIKERQFIERARAIGAGDGHIIGIHVLPNVMPLIFANTVLLIALAIFSEAFLSFFGLSDPDVISWGAMLEGAYNYSAFSKGAWWWILIPGASIIIMVLSFSLVGYALDDVLNPKLRKR
jgi:peptide/nickel transport system permease protein